MNFRRFHRPVLVTVLVAGVGCAALLSSTHQGVSTARPYTAAPTEVSPTSQSFTAGSSYTLAPVNADVPGQKVPNYEHLQAKAISYAQQKVKTLYAAADVQFAVDQQAARDAAVKATKQAAKDAKAKKSTKKVETLKVTAPKPVEKAVKPSVKQWTCLNNLWTGESGWQVFAVNPDSGAYGIPQSLPAKKMAVEGDDWQTNYKTQINWGLKYIDANYGDPCTAWETWSSRSPHWY